MMISECPGLLIRSVGAVSGRYYFNMRMALMKFPQILLKGKLKGLNLFLSLLLLLVLPAHFSYSQVNDINLEHILSDKGLSQNTIHCILQDRQVSCGLLPRTGLINMTATTSKFIKIILMIKILFRIILSGLYTRTLTELFG